MKHSINLQGQIFISSKRASEISDYASDYIGQLCREGKLVCQRIGRAWFVTEASLRTHMSRVWSDDELRKRAANLVRREVKDARRPEIAVDAVSVKRITSKQAALMSGYSADYIGQLCRSGKLGAVLVGKTWMIDEKSLYDHMDVIKKEREQASLKKAMDSKVDISEPELISPITVTNNAYTKNFFATNRVASNVRIIKARTLPFFARKAMFVMSSSVAMVIVAALLVVRFAGVKNDSVHQPLVAAIYDAALSIDNTVTGRGLAVVDRTGDVAKDSAVKADIRNSFSDYVDVVPDETGNAGVITPVFKKSVGKDFMYVMVPVKEATNKSGTTTIQ